MSGRIFGAVCGAVGGALLVLGCADDDPRPVTGRGDVSQLRCSEGAARAVRGTAAGERAIVLGCARTEAGRRIELLSFEDAAGPCLNVVGLPGGRRACGRAPSQRRPRTRAPIGGAAIVRRSGRAPIELYGETAGRIRSVVVRYRRGESRTAATATLLRATERTALELAAIDRPFGYFVASVPATAKGIVAEARAADGRVLGRLDFDPVVESMDPTVFIAGPG